MKQTLVHNICSLNDLNYKKAIYRKQNMSFDSFGHYYTFTSVQSDEECVPLLSLLYTDKLCIYKFHVKPNKLFHDNNF